jgi:hypothetical protein
MTSFAFPSVLDGPVDSRPGREIAADLRMHEEQRVKTSLEYRETVGSEIASSMLKSTYVDDDGAIFIDDSTQMKSTEIKPVADLHLFETRISSLALTRSNLIRDASFAEDESC